MVEPPPDFEPPRGDPDADLVEPPALALVVRDDAAPAEVLLADAELVGVDVALFELRLDCVVLGLVLADAAVDDDLWLDPPHAASSSAHVSTQRNRVRGLTVSG